MVNQPTNTGSTYVLDKLIAVALVVWLLFFGGFSTITKWLKPSTVTQIADTIKTGAGRVVAPAPAARPAAAPVVAPRVNSGAPAAPAADTQAQIEAAADAAYGATAQAVAAARPVIPTSAAQPGALPTAAIAIPTVAPAAQITVVPDLSKPIVYANSGPIEPTPIPTMAYPTPLPATAAAYTVSPDGLCVIASRNGKQYQVCQTWKYKPDEAASVADYIRTGLLPAVEVQ